VWAGALAVGLCTAHVRAQEASAGGAVMVYSDSDNVTVISPRVSGRQTVAELQVDVAAGVDLVTAASVDLVTAASPKGFSEERWQVEARAGRQWAGGSALRGWYALSREPDFLSHQVGVGGGVELRDRHSLLGLGLVTDQSTVGHRYDPTYGRPRTGYSLQATWTEILGPETLFDLAYTAGRQQGMLASPYRFVRIYDPADGGQHRSAVAEAVPDARTRHGLVVGLRSRLLPRWFVLGQARGHSDDWGLLALSATLRMSFSLTPQWTIDAEMRLHGQGRAAFYRSAYATWPQAPAWRTADKELGPMRTWQGGLHVQWRPFGLRPPLVAAGLGADVVRFDYLDYQWLAGRTALVTLAHLTWEP